MAMTDIEVRAARQQMMEVLISEGIKMANRLREFTSSGYNPSIAVSKGGGLALILVPENLRDGIRAHLRFGPVYAASVATNVTLEEINRWNNTNPGHEIERRPIQYALQVECSRVFTLISELRAMEERSPV